MQQASVVKTPFNHKPIVILFVIGFLNTIGPFTVDLYLPAFGQIANHFDTSVSTVSLSLSSYFVGLAAAQLFFGPLLDRFGRKWPLAIGLSIHVLSCVLCALSPNIETFIAVRGLQGVGACVSGVGALAMVRDYFPSNKSASVLAKMMLIVSVSPMLAPTFGGWLSAGFGWKAVFYALGIGVAVILIATLILLPKKYEPDPRVSLKMAPILRDYLSLLRIRQFALYVWAGAFSFAGLFVYVSGAPALMMGEFKLTENEFGMTFAFLSIGLVGGGQFSDLLSKKFSSSQIFSSALLVQVVTAAIYLIGTLLGYFGLTASISLFFIYLACIGLTFPNAAALALAPIEERAGSASGILNFLQISMGAVAAAVFGILPLPAAVSVGVLFLASSVAGSAVYFFGRRS